MWCKVMWCNLVQTKISGVKCAIKRVGLGADPSYDMVWIVMIDTMFDLKGGGGSVKSFELVWSAAREVGHAGSKTTMISLRQ